MWLYHDGGGWEKEKNCPSLCRNTSQQTHFRGYKWDCHFVSASVAAKKKTEKEKKTEKKTNRSRPKSTSNEIIRRRYISWYLSLTVNLKTSRRKKQTEMKIYKLSFGHCWKMKESVCGEIRVPLSSRLQCGNINEGNGLKRS